MFDGQSLAGWREVAVCGPRRSACQDGVIVLSMGDPFTGINWTNDFPKMNYEVALDAMRLMGSDFFCGLTVPVGTNFCSLIVGGWGGSLVGISSLDGMDASENETTKFTSFETGRWYRIRLRVTEKRIQAWIDQDKLVDVVTAGKRSPCGPGDIELSEPFGMAAWQTCGAARDQVPPGHRPRRERGVIQPPDEARSAGTNFASGSDIPRDRQESGRGLPHSKTLARSRVPLAAR